MVRSVWLAIKDEFTSYIAAASFDTRIALKRTIWDVFGAQEIIFHDEERDDPDGDWRTVTTYRLVRR